MKKRVILILAAILLLTSAGLAAFLHYRAAGDSRPESTESEDYESSLRERLARQYEFVWVPAHDHLEANAERLTAIVDAFKSTGEPYIWMTASPGDADDALSSEQTLPPELTAAAEAYLNGATFCERDGVSIFLYDLSYWQECEDKLRAALNESDFKYLNQYSMQPWEASRILDLLDGDLNSDIYAEVKLGREHYSRETQTWMFTFSYYGDPADASDKAIAGHWRCFAEISEMSGL